LSNMNLGKIIERILGKKDENKKKLGSQSISTMKNRYSESPKKAVRPEKIYIKAWVLRSLEEMDRIKDEVNSGNIIIVRLGPLAEKNAEDVKKAVNELYDFTQQINGDIARLGEERVVVTPSFVEIWRGKTI